MSDNPFASDDNPYQAPKITTDSSDIGGLYPSLDRAANMLRQTKPWVRFISVLMFIGAAFMVLVGLIATVAGARMPGAFGPVVGLIYIVMAILYIAPALFLWMYADRIGVFLQNKSPGTLASALEAQKSFWKFVGIVMLIILCVYAIMILGFILAGIAATM